MQLARVFLAAILFCQWVTIPTPAQALSLTGAKQLLQVGTKTVQRYIGRVGRSIGLKGYGDSAGAEIKDESGKVVGYLAIPKASSAVDMAAFSPKALRDMKASKSFLKSNFMRISTDVVMRFPMEAFTFFLAIGIQNARSLVFKYQDNPVAMQQFLQSQKDPVGQVGFLAFMMANSHLTSPLMAMTAPGSAMQSFIPYMGMTAGMLSSNLVSEIAQFPQMNACVAEINVRSADPKKYESCQKAYNSWTQVIADKGYDMIPQMLSLTASMVLSGLVERYVIEKVLVAIGVEFVFAVTTDGLSLAAKGGRVLYSVAKNLLFLDLNNLMKPLVETPFTNMRQGLHLNSIETDIVKSIFDKKDRGWNRTAPRGKEDLDAKLQALIEANRSWRRFNLSDISQIHSTWHQYMNNFISTYKGAEDFYISFGEERKKHIKANPNDPSLLDTQLVLAGVHPKSPEGDFKDVKLEPLANPDAVKFQQVQTLISVREKYSALLDDTMVAQVISNKRRARSFQTFLKGLPTKEDFTLDKVNYENIGNSLEWLNYETDPINSYPGLIAPTPRKTGYYGDYRDFLNKIRSEIGNPMPMKALGMGYLQSYEEDTKIAAIHKSIQVPRTVKRIHTIRPSDYFVAQMLTGPDVKAKSTTLVDFNRWIGYPARFLPPRVTVPLTLDFNDPYVDQDALFVFPIMPTVFNVPTMVKFQGSSAKYKSIYDVLRDSNTHQSSIFSGQGISSWWKTDIEPKFIKAWETFDVRYFKNVEKLVELLQDHRDSSFNLGPIANNPLDSIVQERRLYTLILGELYKDSVLAINPTLLSGQSDPRFQTKIDYTNVKMKRDVKTDPAFLMEENCFYMKSTEMMKSCQLSRNQEVAYVPLLRLLKLNYNFDLANLIKGLHRGIGLPTLYSVTNARNLRFQNDLELSFGRLEGQMKAFKIEKTEINNGPIYTEFGAIDSIETQTKLTSSRRNKDFLDAQKNVESELNSVRTLFESSGVALNPFQKSILEKCIYGLTSLADEISTLGMMANSGSYARSEGASDDATRFFGDCSNKALVHTKDVTGRRLAIDKCREKAFKEY